MLRISISLHANSITSQEFTLPLSSIKDFKSSRLDLCFDKIECTCLALRLVKVHLQAIAYSSTGYFANNSSTRYLSFFIPSHIVGYFFDTI